MIVPVDISYHDSHYCSSQGSHMGKTVYYFPPGNILHRPFQHYDIVKGEDSRLVPAWLLNIHN